jgi:hypothetical protein
MTLRACVRCRRHFGLESVCPFCGATAESVQRIAAPSKLSRAAIFASTLLAGCYTSSPPPQGPPPPPPPPHEDQVQQPPPDDGRQFADPPPPVATAGIAISGTITDSNTKSPMANIPLQLQSASQPSMPVRTTTTDAAGKYSFADVPPGSYYLLYGYAHPRRGRPQTTVVVESQPKVVDLKIYPPPQSNIPMPYGAPPARTRIV